jgi:glycosyltransferase involved in cell wall biosynthesis
LLLDALNQLRANSRWHVLMVGDGELQSELSVRLATENLSDRIQMIGAVPHHTTLDLIAAADCLLLPSKYEFAPITLMEALALNTPSIVTPVGDSWLMIGEGELPPAGMSVPIGDSVALAAAIKRIMDEPMLLPQLAAGCRDRAGLYSQEHYITQRRILYEQYLHHQKIPQVML